MALLVIGIHILPPVAFSVGRPLGLPGWAVVADIVCRCAVPYYFIASGYYFRPERGAAANVKKAITRLVPIYIVWYVLYLAAAYFIDGKFPVRWRIMDIFDGGPAFHLWFIPALIFGLITLTLTLAIGGRTLAIVVAILFAFMGPVLANYHSLFGIESYPSHLNDVRRQLAAPGFLVIGYLFKHQREADLSTGLPLLGFALLAMFAERYIVTIGLGNKAVGDAESLVAVFAYGASVFNVARYFNGALNSKLVQTLAGLSLGIFLIHPFFIWIIEGNRDVTLLRYTFEFVTVSVLSTVAALVLARHQLTKRLVT